MRRHYVLDARTATDHFPGIGRYVAHLAHALDRLLNDDEEMTVLYRPDAPARQPVCPHTWQHTTCLPVPFSPFTLSQQWRIPALLHHLRATRYHSPYYLMPYRPRCSTLLTVYDVIPLRYPYYVSWRARFLFRVMKRLAIRTADTIIAISNATAQDMQTFFGVDPTRLHVIPLAADRRFRPLSPTEQKSARTRMGLPERYVLYVGSNKPHKNLTRLVRAWATLRPSDTTLVIAGAWLPTYPEPLQLAMHLGLNEQHVRFLGPVDEPDLPALYASALAFVFPSLYEGFGLPVLEAMACGVPVACSNVSSLPEVAGNAALLFDPHDTDAIVAALERLLGDAALRETLAQLGREQAARFSWEATARQTLTLYRSTSSP